MSTASQHDDACSCDSCTAAYLTAWREEVERLERARNTHPQPPLYGRCRCGRGRLHYQYDQELLLREQPGSYTLIESACVEGRPWSYALRTSYGATGGYYATRAEAEAALAKDIATAKRAA